MRGNDPLDHRIAGKPDTQLSSSADNAPQSRRHSDGRFHDVNRRRSEGATGRIREFP
jgi:hypothetical protein